MIIRILTDEEESLDEIRIIDSEDITQEDLAAEAIGVIQDFFDVEDSCEE
jgi:hypothetical protein